MEEYLEAVEAGAPPGEVALLTAVAIDLAKSGLPFTTDDIWAKAQVTGEPRMIGAVIRKLALSGWIRGTGRYVPTIRPEAHKRPIKEWVGAAH